MHDLVTSEAFQRHREVLQDAERAAFRRKVLAARRWDRRAAHAARRARLAAQALSAHSAP